MTSMASLCLQLVGYAESDEVLGGVIALNGEDCSWSSQRTSAWSLYYWYYLTQMKFHHGGRTWRSWNDKFAREYVKNQNADGSWTSPHEAGGGHGEATIGPVFTTALSALTLQVYYRHLPTYQQIEVRQEVDITEDPDEIRVKI